MQFIESHGVKVPIDAEIIGTDVQKKLRKGHYENAESIGLPKFLTPEDRILEIGAGIGFISTFIANQIGATDMTCVEANPVLTDYIEKIHAFNNVKGARVLNAVLLPDSTPMPPSGTVEFHVTEPFWSSSFENPKNLPATIVETPAQYLSEVIEEHRPTAIVCDIEGGEAGLFDQVDFGEVQHIYVELHRRYIGLPGVRRMFHDLHRHDFVYSPRASDGTQVLFDRLPRKHRGKF